MREIYILYKVKSKFPLPADVHGCNDKTNRDSSEIVTMWLPVHVPNGL